MNTALPRTWIKTADELPPEGVAVATKIDGDAGCRNEAPLRRRGRLWYDPEETMYVYYSPTHWARLTKAEALEIADQSTKRLQGQTWAIQKRLAVDLEHAQ